MLCGIWFGRKSVQTKVSIHKIKWLTESFQTSKYGKQPISACELPPLQGFSMCGNCENWTKMQGTCMILDSGFLILSGTVGSDLLFLANSIDLSLSITLHMQWVDVRKSWNDGWERSEKWWHAFCERRASRQELPNRVTSDGMHPSRRVSLGKLPTSCTHSLLMCVFKLEVR